MSACAHNPFVVGLVAVVLFSLVGTGIAAGLAGKHLILPGETLSGIARKEGVAMDCLVRVNGIANPDRIRAGRFLEVASCKTGTPVIGGTEREPARRSRLSTTGGGDVYPWKPASDPVNGAGPGAGPAAVKRVLDTMGGANQGEATEVWQQMVKIGYNAELITLPDGTLAARHLQSGEIVPLSGVMAGGHGITKPFRAIRVAPGHTLKDRRATLLFDESGKVLVRPAVCDNIVTGKTTPPKVVETPKGRTPICVAEGSHPVEGGAGFGSSAGHRDLFVGLEMACLHRTKSGWKVGPMIHGAASWFDDRVGGGRAAQGHVGLRFRSPNGEWKFDIGAGAGDLRWATHGGDVRLGSSGLDAYFSPQWVKQMGPRWWLEVLGYINVPVTDTHGDVIGKGWVNRGAARRPISAGIGSRQTFDIDPKWPVLLETYEGLFFLDGPGGDGLRLTGGGRTRNRAWTAYGGLRILFDSGKVGIAGIEHSWGGKGLYLDGKGRQDAVKAGQAVSIDAPVNLDRGTPRPRPEVRTAPQPSPVSPARVTTRPPEGCNLFLNPDC